MYYTFPDYINEFRCTANECPETCCAGWKICVDRDSLNRYLKLRGKYRFKLMRSINFAGRIFRQTKDGRCAFLKADGLCDMYMNLGPESLCRTCRNYPKRVERYENVREVTLSLSCPEVARLLMSRKEKTGFMSREDKISEEIPGSDPFLYSAISELKAGLIEVLQSRELKIEHRAGLAFAICNDAQKKISSRELFGCAEVIEKYKKRGAAGFVADKVKSILDDKEQYHRIMRGAFLSLYEFETLKKDWPGLILRTEMYLYDQGPDACMTLTAKFNEWRAANEMFDIQMEQLLVYYVSAFFDRATYDGDVLSKIHMALIPAAVIHELALSHWSRNRDQLSDEDMARIAWRFSRETEHSDINLKLLEECRFKGEKS